MGTNEINLREFGEMVSNVRTLLVNQVAIKDDLTEHQKVVKDDLSRYQENIRLQMYDSNKRIFEKLDGVRDSVSELEKAVSGMKPVCQQHTDDIAKLKERPGRLVEIGSAAIAAVCAAAMWLTRH